MNDIISDLVVDGEQQSDIKNIVHFSPEESTLKDSDLSDSAGGMPQKSNCHKEMVDSAQEKSSL